MLLDDHQVRFLRVDVVQVPQVRVGMAGAAEHVAELASEHGVDVADPALVAVVEENGGFAMLAQRGDDVVVRVIH